LRITRIYYSGDINPGNTITLSPNASNHLIRVLRYRKGTRLTVFNGGGGEYAAVLLDQNPRAVSVGINEYTGANRESPLQLVLLQGISRSDHMDSTIQKVTELGTSAIYPVICERSRSVGQDRMKRKRDRWQQIIISACEQSGRNRLPELHEPVSLDAAIIRAASPSRLVLDPTAADSIKTIPQQPGPVTVLCGPEGGLTQQEIETACRAGFTRISFGPRILRTETAGPAFVSALQTLWGDLG